MFDVYTCLTERHDLRLVLVAGLVCLLASWTALSLARRGVEDCGRARFAWLAVASTVAGCGIWATHFIAMLAFASGVPTAFDPGLTACSVVVAIAGAGVAFGLTTETERRSLWLGGALLGFSIGAMHYAGMAALRVPAVITWHAVSVAASMLLGAAFGATSFLVAFRRKRVGTGALLLTIGICALHFTGMSALHLEPAPFLAVREQGISAWWLALGIAAASAVILAAAIAGMVFDQHLARRSTRETERLRALVDATFEGILIQADGIAVDLNESLAALLGYERAALIGRSVRDLVAPEHAQLGDPVTIGEGRALETELVRADGTRVPVEILQRAIEHQGRPARVLAVRDVTERLVSEQRIHHLAYHDALTELPNRLLLREHLQRALGRAERGGNLAVLCLDLDRFKVVNDTLGHPIGDSLLRATATRLQACLRKSDLVARLGGDEFAIVQENAAQPSEATALCRRLVEALSKPFDIDGHQVVVGASIGVMLTMDGAADPDTLLKSADLALYRAKSDGRGTWRFFEAEMDAQMQARRLLELDLRQALPKGQLEVHYQPLINAAAGSISGLEALLRWRHPERGLVSPGSFIPLAEEIGLIGTIGTWVLRQACADAATWPGTPQIAVNLSPMQFRDRKLAVQVAEVIAETGLAPSRLELEVTESLLLGNDAEILALLHDLRRLGVRIAMDDFGTGYSSLSYLRRFPFDKIKIDQSFVRGMGEQEDCAAIVRAVVGLGRSLGMSVNAEGVETAEQLEALRAEGCGEVQGYLFSQAQPAADIFDMLTAQASEAARTASAASETVPKLTYAA